MSLPVGHPVVRPNGRGRQLADPDVTWRQRLQALRHQPRLLRMVWGSEPRYVVGILLLRVARSAVPLAVLWIGKLIVDEVVHAIATAGSGGPVPWSRLGTLVGIELVIALVGE
jgi:ATP-binding cassette, subfamily B, bacterial